MPEPFVSNPRRNPGHRPASSSASAVRDYHRGLPDYAVTPLHPLAGIAAEYGIGAVLLKDESLRLGLPAFKMLGASWAVHRALAERAPDAPQARLVTATDGNHGRAVARMARLLGLPATIAIPRGVSDGAIALIRAEGAEVLVLDESYDDTVEYAARLADADPNALLIQDTSWPGYEEVPQWIVDGYTTLFDEAAEQAAESGRSIDLIIVPAGVGSLAHAAVLFAAGQPGCSVVTVEPTVAACIGASLESGELTTVPTGETSMAGLNCGTPSYLAWPDLQALLAGSVTVDDAGAAAAVATLAGLGIDSGACGGSGLAALEVVTREPARTALGLGPDSTVLLINTEGSRSTSG